MCESSQQTPKLARVCAPVVVVVCVGAGASEIAAGELLSMRARVGAGEKG